VLARPGINRRMPPRGDEEKRLVRLSALVHDLGHGPFSHVSEGALELFADRERLKDRLKTDNNAKIHEFLTQDLLRSDAQLNHLIGGSTISKIISLLSYGYGEPILKSVVSASRALPNCRLARCKRAISLPTRVAIRSTLT
jgi:uncharacterized protein